MLTRQIDDSSVESSRDGAGSGGAVGGGGDDEHGLGNLDTVQSTDEGWAVVSLPGGEDGSATGLDLNSVNQGSGVSSLSGTNGGALDGQTILSSLGPGDDDEDDDDLLLFDENNIANPPSADNPDNLSIPDTVPSNVRSIRSSDPANAADASSNLVGCRDRRQSNYDLVLVAILALLTVGASVLASTWRSSALRLEAELDALRSNDEHNDRIILRNGARNSNRRSNNKNKTSWESSRTTFTSPPLFGEQEQEDEPTPFTVADNCYIKAKASISLGTCGNEIKDNIQNASATVLDNIANIATQFGKFWKMDWESSPSSRSKGSHRNISSTRVFEKLNKFWKMERDPSNSFSGGGHRNTSARVFQKLNKLWKTERDRWNKASERFASEFSSAAACGARNVSSSAKVLANRTATTAFHTADVFSESAIKIADEVGSLVSSIFSSHTGSAIIDTLSHTNEAIDHSIWNMFDHARDAIEESTNIVRYVNIGAGEDVKSSPSVQSRGLLQFLNLTTYTLPHFGHAKVRHEKAKPNEQSKGLLQFVPNMFLNLTSFKLIAHELPAFGERK